MADIECFMIAKSSECRMELRRYAASEKSKCPLPFGYHNASRPISVGPARYCEPQYNGACGNDWPLDDPRWPTHCECGYAFEDDDRFQCNEHWLWKNEARGIACTLHDAPVGAMWLADWYGDWVGPDKLTLVVMTPAGEWVIDGPAYNGGQATPHAWTRTGSPPVVTAHPSIHFPDKYHGWLRDGKLTEC